MDGRYPSDPSFYAPGSIDVSKPTYPSLIPVFITLLVILVIAVLVGIWLYRTIPRRTNGTTGESAIPDSEGPAEPVGCTSDQDCPSLLPVCETATSTCVQCLIDPDCSLGFECSDKECCVNEDPMITGVTPTTDVNSSILVTYTHGPAFTPGSIAEVSLEALTGAPIMTKSGTADGVMTISQSEIPGPIKYLFPNYPYQVRVRITFSCGAFVNSTTGYSAPFQFTMPSCGALANIPNQGATSGSDNPGFNNHPGMIVRHFTESTPRTLTYLLHTSPNFHPNFASIVYANVTTTTSPIVTPLQFAELPFTGMPGDTFYVRYVRVGNGTTCISNLSAEFIHNQIF